MSFSHSFHTLMKLNPKNQIKLMIAAIVMLMLVGLGWRTGERRARHADTKMREHLLQQTTDIASAINPELVKKITFTAADKGTPAFEQIREQMIYATDAIPKLRSIYSMAEQSDKIVFGPDNLAPDDEDHAPPGDLYQSPPTELYQLLRDKRPITVGPYTDEWGIFVSAFAPILDPHNDDVLMVVGVDILAGDWQAGLNAASRGPLLTVFALMLILAGGAMLVHLRNRRMKLDRLKLKAWILAPIAAALLIGLTLYGTNEYKNYENESNQNMYRITEQVRGEWNRSVASAVQLLEAQIDHVSVNPRMLKAWQDRDFSSLTALAQPAFEQLKRDYKITHYYFIAPDRTCFLRAHQPYCHGDLIDRSTLLSAANTVEDAWGIELGPLGTFTLRYVRPWKQDGATMGYLELGMEIEHLVTQLAKTSNVDLLTVIRKEYTTQENFEAGKKAFGFTGQWEAYPDFVIAHQTGNDLPKEMAQWLGHDRNTDTRGEVFNARQGDRRLACGIIHLPDTAGRSVAELVVMRDVTAQFHAARSDLLLNIGLAMALFGSALILLGSVTGTAERQLDMAFSKVRTEKDNLKAIFASSPMGMLLLDEETMIVDANAVIADMVLRDPAQVIGQRGGGGLGCVHSFENEKGCGFSTVCPQCPLRKGILQVLTSSTSVHGAEIQPTLMMNGRQQRPWLSVSAEPVILNGHKHVIVAVENITERKQTQEALKVNKARLDLALQSSQMGVWEFNLIKNKRIFDNQTCSLLGIDPAAFGGTADEFFTAMHPEDREKVKAALTKTMEQGVPYDPEYRVVWPDGSMHHVSSRGQLRQDDQGNPQMISGILWDITARKKVEEALHSRTALLEAQTNATLDGILVVDEKRKRILTNQRIIELLDVPQPILDDEDDAALLKHVVGLTKYPEKFLEIVMYLYDHQNETSRDEIELKSGMVLDRYSAPVLGKDGKYYGRIWTFRDVTDRKKAEEAIRAALIQASAANQAKSEFLANMSHEIRTPMNSILGFSELLSNESLAPEHAKFVQTIHDSGESLLTLINDILDFSKIEAKKLDLEILDFDLRDLLEDFAGMMAVRAQEKGLEFLCSANPDVPSYVQGDPSRLRQILTNLTGNAFKFTEKGEVAVRVTVVSTNDTEVMLRFSVRDTGIGIPAEKLDRLFKSFSQVDSSTTRQYGGTGLGLIISKQLSEMMGGEMGVCSEKGKGSEFWFTVRLSQQHQKDRTRTIPAQIKGIRILVVDNNASNREILTMRLASWGAVVAESSDGPSALETMQKSKTTNTPFDVVITDMQMPGMDGLMLGRAIRQEEGLCKPRLILMTSLGQQNNTPEFAQIGFAACLTKPVRPSELYARLTAVLTGTPHTEVSHPIAGQDSVSPIQNGMIRILLADDSTINQIVTTKMLEQLGYRSDAVANGQEAITSLCTLPYDLVLMDCQMPEMDGYEATRAIRGGSSGVPNPQVPIIAITANAMQGDRGKCLEAGMSDYLSKPVQLQGLAAVLERWLPQEADAPKICPAGTVMEPTATARAEK